MTFFLEVSGPFQWKPHVYRSRVMTRITWGLVAVGAVHVPFYEFCTTAYAWQMR